MMVEKIIIPMIRQQLLSFVMIMIMIIMISFNLIKMIKQHHHHPRHHLRQHHHRQSILFSAAMKANENDDKGDTASSATRRRHNNNYNDQQRNNIVSVLKQHQSQIKTIRIRDDLFSLKGFRSPTLKGLRTVLDLLPNMNNLEEIDISGGLFIENDHDVKILTNCISRRCSKKSSSSSSSSSLLRSIKLLDFQCYASEKHRDSEPLLESFVQTAIMPSSTSTSRQPNNNNRLQELHIKCRASYKVWKQSYISTQTIRQLVCLCSSLQKLELSNLGLTDDHLQVVATELSSTNHQNSVLTELILNKNRNTDVGLHALIESLMKRDSIIEKLEVYNNARPTAPTSELLLKQLDINHTIKYLSINSRYQDKAEIEFFLLLNRTNRRALLNPKTNPNDAIEILDAAKDDVSMLLYFLRQNPSLCNIAATKLEEEMNVDDDTPISSSSSVPETSIEETNNVIETQESPKVASSEDDASSTSRKAEDTGDEDDTGNDERNLCETQESLKESDDVDASLTPNRIHGACSTLLHKAEEVREDNRKGEDRRRGSRGLFLRRTGSIKNLANDIISRFFR